MEDSKDQKFVQVLNAKFEDLVTKEDVAIMGLAIQANLANGRLKFIRWMFLLTIAQALITELAVHFWMK
jgi:hypothetical protein